MRSAIRSICGFALLLVTVAPTTATAGPQFLTPYHQFDPGTPRQAELADLDGDGRLDIVVLSSDNQGIWVRLGDGAGDFETKVLLPIPALPIACAVAHVNTDAHLDVVATHGANGLSVFYGNGDGTFGDRVDTAVGNSPTAIAVGDLDEDGHNDIVVTCEATDQLWILFGLFDQFWFPVVQVPTQFDPVAVRLADLNADDHLDVVYLNQGSSTIASRLGDGTGALAAPVTAGGYSGMRDLVVANLDQDAILDLATTNNDQGSVAVFLGAGDGSFQLPVTYAAGPLPRGLTVMQANADAIPDLAVALFDKGSIALLLGTGNGAFAAPVEIVAGVSSIDVSAADLDGDTKSDLAVTNASGISIHHSNGNGTFGFEPPMLSLGSGHKYVRLADLDVDGKLDLVVASRQDASLDIRWGIGDGTFELGPALSTGADPLGLAIGDVNGDWWLDLVTADAVSSTVSIFVRSGPRSYTSSGSLSIPGGLRRVELTRLDADSVLDLVVLGDRNLHLILGLGGGSFGPVTTIPVWQSFALDDDLDVADVSLDGNVDVLVSHQACCPSEVWQFLGNGDGSVQPATLLRSVNMRVGALALGLLDADAAPDLVVALHTAASSQRDPMEIHGGNGDGTYELVSDSQSGSDPRWAEVDDLNGDLAGDVIVANRSQPSGVFIWARPGGVSVYPGLGDGSFGMRVDFGLDGYPTRLAAGDLNGDGALDLVVSDESTSRVFVLLNRHVSPTDASEVVPTRQTSAQLDVRRVASGALRIEYDLGASSPSQVALQIFDVRGRRIRSLENGIVAPGPQARTWDGRDDAGVRVARGVYWVSLRTPTANLERKIVRLER